MISELKLNDHLKIDGRKVDVLLLGLRNAYHLRQNLLIAKDLTVKFLAIFFFIPLTVAGTCGFSAESKRL